MFYSIILIKYCKINLYINILITILNCIEKQF